MEWGKEGQQPGIHLAGQPENLRELDGAWTQFPGTEGSVATHSPVWIPLVPEQGLLQAPSNGRLLRHGFLSLLRSN